MEHVELLKKVRDVASTVIAIGACAVTGGIPALAGVGALETHVERVYGDGRPPRRRRTHRTRCRSTAVIDVDYRVPGCPIEPEEFVRRSSAPDGPVGPTPTASRCARRARWPENSLLLRDGRRVSRPRHPERVRRQVRVARPAVHGLPRDRRRRQPGRRRGPASSGRACASSELSRRVRALQLT